MSEAKIAVLENKVETLETWAERHERDDRQTHKYMTNMMEDLLARLGGIERSASRFEADLAHRNGEQLTTKQSLEEINGRIQTLERLAYIVIGGMLSVGTLFTFIGWPVLKAVFR